MQCISIQIHSSAIPDFDRGDFLARISFTGRSPEIDAFEEKGVSYLNFNFFTEKPAALWRELNKSIYLGEYGDYMKKVSIVACETDQHPEGLLLHHYDPRVALDRL